MKEKKGKKSLEDTSLGDNSLDNLVVKRSTRLKELSKLLPNQQFGTYGVSIPTTSSSSSDALPPSYFIDNDSVTFCEKIGKYETVPCPIRYTPSSLARFFNLNETNNVKEYVNLDRTLNAQKGTGWKFNVYPGDWSNIVPGATTKGYLFIYFQQSFERSDCGYISDRKAGGVCSAIYNNKTEVTNTNQGEIFAVVISNISQINALNRTGAIQTGGKFLSNAINDAKGFNFKLANGNGLVGYFVDYFLDTISKNFTDTTPIRSVTTIPNPITTISTITEISFNNYTNYTNDNSIGIAIPLSDLIRFDRFNDSGTGSGIFTVKKSYSINNYYFQPESSLIAYNPKFKPMIYSQVLGKDEFLLSEGGLYLNITKPSQDFYTNFYTPRYLFFTLVFTQPDYLRQQQNTDVYYPSKILALEFKVIF